MLQDYGPESAIRRFNSALQRGDLLEVQSVTEQPLDSPTAQELIYLVNTLLQQGFSYQLLKMDRQPGQVRAAVVYSRGKYQIYPVIMVVEKDQRVWKIDADKTVTIKRDAFGSGRP